MVDFYSLTRGAGIRRDKPVCDGIPVYAVMVHIAFVLNTTFMYSDVKGGGRTKLKGLAYKTIFFIDYLQKLERGRGQARDNIFKNRGQLTSYYEQV